MPRHLQRVSRVGSKKRKRAKRRTTKERFINLIRMRIEIMMEVWGFGRRAMEVMGRGINKLTYK